jgi:hypothetical protein
MGSTIGSPSVPRADLGHTKSSHLTSTLDRLSHGLSFDLDLVCRQNQRKDQSQGVLTSSILTSHGIYLEHQPGNLDLGLCQPWPSSYLTLASVGLGPHPAWLLLGFCLLGLAGIEFNYYLICICLNRFQRYFRVTFTNVAR